MGHIVERHPDNIVHVPNPRGSRTHLVETEHIFVGEANTAAQGPPSTEGWPQDAAYQQSYPTTSGAVLQQDVSRERERWSEQTSVPREREPCFGF